MSMSEMTTPATRPLFPAITPELIVTVLLAGVAADLAWEVWASLSFWQALPPIWPGRSGPAPLPPCGSAARWSRRALFSLSSALKAAFWPR